MHNQTATSLVVLAWRSGCQETRMLQEDLNEPQLIMLTEGIHVECRMWWMCIIEPCRQVEHRSKRYQENLRDASLDAAFRMRGSSSIHFSAWTKRSCHSKLGELIKTSREECPSLFTGSQECTEWNDVGIVAAHPEKTMKKWWHNCNWTITVFFAESSFSLTKAENMPSVSFFDPANPACFKFRMQLCLSSFLQMSIAKWVLDAPRKAEYSSECCWCKANNGTAKFWGNWTSQLILQMDEKMTEQRRNMCGLTLIGAFFWEVLKFLQAWHKVKDLTAACLHGSIEADLVWIGSVFKHTV